MRPGFVSEVEKLISEANGQLDFAELVCPPEELKQRMGNDSRSEFGKLTSVELFEQLQADGVFDAPEMPEAAVRIDTSVWPPVEAAHQIVQALGLAG